MWYELVVKCTIKVTKALQQDINSVDLAALLLAIHEVSTLHLGKGSVKAGMAR